jgi:hypothetical protein
MSHDKISAAARRRMAETGEPYAAARRAVLSEHQAASDPQWFPMSYEGIDRFSLWMDRYLFNRGPERSGVEVGPELIRVRGVGDFRIDIPRASVRSVARSDLQARGTIGVHETKRGRWLVNGSAGGLVELEIDPPLYLGRMLSTAFLRRRVDTLTLSMADPDGFVAAVRR